MCFDKKRNNSLLYRKKEPKMWNNVVHRTRTKNLK